MMGYFRALLLTKSSSSYDPYMEMATIRENILRISLLIGLSISIVICCLSIPALLISNQWIFIFFLVLVVILLLSATLIRKTPYKMRSWVAIACFYFFASTSLLIHGLNSSAEILLVGLVFLSAVLLGPRASFVSAAIVLSSMLLIGYLSSNHLISLAITESHDNASSFPDWFSHAAILFLLCGFIDIVLSNLLNGLLRCSIEQRNYLDELRHSQQLLEEKVQTSTDEAGRKDNELRIASQIAQQFNSSREVDQFLPKILEIIETELGFYYGAIFLVDEHKEFATLRWGTGEPGKAMLSINHRLRIDESSFVGYAIVNRQYILSQNVENNLIHYKNPFLPDTRSELALPLIENDEVIGALDVQSNQSGYFSPDMILFLQTVADQLAAAIEKSRIMKRLSQLINELHESQLKATEQAWHNFHKTAKRSYAYRYADGVIQVSENSSEQAQKAMESGQMLIRRYIQPGTGQPETHVAIPVMLRSQAIGVLELCFELEHLSKNTVDFLQAAAQRLATSLENARLLEEIQLKAARDRMINNITAKVRSESSIDKVLQTVAAELGHSLNVSDVLVQLRGDD